MPENNPDPAKTSSFFAELKQRKVFRVAATYAVVSWLIIQIASTTFSGFGIPDWAFRFVVLMLIIGFPVAIILAWAFEMTPDGVKLTKSVTTEERANTSSAKRNWVAIGFAAALPTLIFGTLAVVFYFGRSGQDAGDATVGPAGESYHLGSIAVLPLEIISGGDTLSAMAEGLQEELLTQFSDMDPLSVVSKTSTLRYRNDDKSIREIGEELGADFVVEGSLRQNGPRWRLTLQPIEAATDLHLGSLDYDFDSEVEDLLLFQKQAAWAAAIDIYQAIRKQRPLVGQAGDRQREHIAAMIAYMEETEQLFWGNDTAGANPGLLEPLLEKTRRIMRADPDNGVVHRKYLTFLGQLGYAFAGDGGARLREMQMAIARALRLSPEHFDTQIHTGTFYLLAVNRPDQALPYLQKGLVLYERDGDFSHNWPYYHLARAMHLTGSSAAALKVLDRVPDDPQFDQLFYWWEPLELTRQFEKGIGFLQRHQTRAIEEGDERAALELSRRIAEFEAWWTGSSEPIRAFQLSVKDDPLATPGLNARLLFTMQDYAGALEEMDAMDTGSDPYAYDPVTLRVYRGIALRESGNVQIARSYFLNSIKTIHESGYVFQAVPAFGNAVLSYLNAAIDNKEEALGAAEKSDSFMDPSRNLPLYFLSNGMLASGFVELGEIDRACQKLELLLSGPTGSSTGRVLVEFRNPVLFQDPRFQTVIRKHADQLKDPGILDEYFAVEE